MLDSIKRTARERKSNVVFLNLENTMHAERDVIGAIKDETLGMNNIDLADYCIF